MYKFDIKIGDVIEVTAISAEKFIYGPYKILAKLDRNQYLAFVYPKKEKEIITLRTIHKITKLKHWEDIYG